ncbi:hypothetical protein [Cytobacillus dafuensis]|uniref:DUF2178 domain-containing protein n=1 Tax=Cytobacillus dafuensis TaxID=1742359 RepID=A0A5B8ZCR6_CYTDA|nr:hypothetical protein [Cytobacillus dafuensis]QED49559.1 hypothetical protein FSZ17_21100 [Cytobacillus dafuensis]
MQVNFMTIIIGAIASFAIVSTLTGQIHWGIIAGLLIGVGGAKWIRLEKQKASDEIEYDERVNNNIKQVSFQTFSISNLLLLIYLLISDQILNESLVKASYLIIYISITFLIAFYIIPIIVRKR